MDLIKKEDLLYESYALLEILGAEPTQIGADSSLIDEYLTLELNSDVLNQIEEIKEEQLNIYHFIFIYHQVIKKL